MGASPHCDGEERGRERGKAEETACHADDLEAGRRLDQQRVGHEGGPDGVHQGAGGLAPAARAVRQHEPYRGIEERESHADRRREHAGLGHRPQEEPTGHDQEQATDQRQDDDRVVWIALRPRSDRLPWGLVGLALRAGCDGFLRFAGVEGVQPLAQRAHFVSQLLDDEFETIDPLVHVPP